jgi:transposase
MKRQVFDQAFKQMAVELSYAKGSVKVAAAELGIDPGRLSKWRQIGQDGNVAASEKPGLTAEQLEIKRLQKELKEAQLERDILKKAVGIFSKSDGKYFNS